MRLAQTERHYIRFPGSPSSDFALAVNITAEYDLPLSTVHSFGDKCTDLFLRVLSVSALGAVHLRPISLSFNVL